MNPSIKSVIPVQLKFEAQEKLHKNLNVRSILVEIQQGLEEFYKTGTKHIIDLDAIPLSAFERIKLLDLLGKGEVLINLSLLGESQIYETQFAGVWIIKHLNELGQISNAFIEITDIPDLVLSQKEDISILTEELQLLIDGL